MLHLKKTTNLKQILPFIRKYSLSAGAAVFLAFTFLLILGVCKFSFYALKNHRNVRERNIISSYADVPTNAVFTEKTSYALADRTKRISSPLSPQKQIYVKNDKADNKFDTNLAAPVLALNVRPVINEYKRPPVISSKTDNSIENTHSVMEFDEKNDDAVSLDNLMISGINLLTESSEKIIASENLLKDEPFVDEKKTSESTPLEKEGKDEKVIKIKTEPTVVTTNAEKIKQRQNTPSKTYWVDVDHLRSQIKSQITSESENTVLLTADAASHTIQKEQPRFENVSSVSKTSNESVSLKEKTSSTAFSSIPTKKIAEAVKKESKTALAGNSPELWKIAKVKGQKENVLDKRDSAAEEKTNNESDPNSLLTVSSEEENKNIIYRNGRPTDVVIKKQQKSLNWLERQEAAVWTSMSQTDTPSVWSAAADASDVPAERAKAFRVAEDITTTQETTSTEEQNVNMASDAQATQTITENNSVEEKAKTDQEKDVLNSAPLRVIGEKEKPEGKINPLLLPLGNPTPTNLPTTNVSTPVQTTPINEKPTLTEQAPPALPKVNPTGLSEILSQQKENPEQKNQKTENSEENDGLMNKLFSFFGKTETDPDEMPSLGTGSSVKSKENTNKNTKKKQTKRKVVSSSKNQIVKDDDKDIITTEMRLTFKPSSSEISAQSVKWIKDFGQRAKLDIQNAIEVRMSNLDQEIQEKRFALIRSALLGVGLQEVQIIPVVTDRTPHTIVLRMIVLPEEGYTEYTTELGGVKERMYYKKW